MTNEQFLFLERATKALETIANKLPDPPEPKKEWEKELPPATRHQSQLAAWKRIKEATDIIDDCTRTSWKDQHLVAKLMDIRKVLTGNNR